MFIRVLDDKSRDVRLRVEAIDFYVSCSTVSAPSGCMTIIYTESRTLFVHETPEQIDTLIQGA
jgi:hypothetical protein